ncbi:MAG: hypothetical protein JKY42_01970 [Flavobacteriales bacterium]|nr:hypothetical protein [Flavobacteriales bacterium]
MKFFLVGFLIILSLALFGQYNLDSDLIGEPDSSLSSTKKFYWNSDSDSVLTSEKLYYKGKLVESRQYLMGLFFATTNYKYDSSTGKVSVNCKHFPDKNTGLDTLREYRCYYYDSYGEVYFQTFSDSNSTRNQVQQYTFIHNTYDLDSNIVITYSTTPYGFTGWATSIFKYEYDQDNNRVKSYIAEFNNPKEFIFTHSTEYDGQNRPIKTQYTNKSGYVEYVYGENNLLKVKTNNFDMTQEIRNAGQKFQRDLYKYQYDEKNRLISIEHIGQWNNDNPYQYRYISYFEYSE